MYKSEMRVPLSASVNLDSGKEVEAREQFNSHRRDKSKERSVHFPLRKNASPFLSDVSSFSF